VQIYLERLRKTCNAVPVADGEWFARVSNRRFFIILHECIVKYSVAYPGIFFRGGDVKQIQLGTEDRQNGDLGAVAPYSGVLEAAVIWNKKFHFI